MNRAQLLQSFLNGAKNGSASSLSIIGDKLFSYATCIAERVDGVLVVNVTKYSRTTTVQQIALLRAAEAARLPVRKIGGIQRDTKQLNGVPATGKEYVCQLPNA